MLRRADRPVLALLGLLLAAGAQAMSIREFRGLEQTEPGGALYARYYLVGVMEGLREAAERDAREGRAPRFCVRGRQLEPRMALSLFQGELRRHPDTYEADMPVELVLSNALHDSFRCN